MGAVRVWRGDGDESKDQGVAFDKWLEVMWANLAKIEKTSTVDEPSLEAEYEEEDEEEEEDYGDEEEEEEEGEGLVSLYG